MSAPHRDDFGLVEAVVGLIISSTFVCALFMYFGPASSALAPGVYIREFLVRLGLPLSRIWILPLTIPPWWCVFSLVTVLVRGRLSDGEH